MAAIKLQANTTGIGTVTIAAPNTNNDRTITIPADVTGNVVISDGSLITASYGASTLAFGGTVDMTGATVKGIGAWTIQNSNNATLTAGQNLFANTRAGALTLNLPTSATIGSTIRVIDNEGLCSSNNITINRNGHNIDGSARNVVLNVDRQGVQLVYVSGDTGWATVKKERETQKTGAQGEVSGYVTAGDTSPGYDVIEKYPFATDTNTSSVGTLTLFRIQPAGTNSNENGYVNAGLQPTLPGIIANVDKYPFSTDTNATDVGSLTQARRHSSGQNSKVAGYVSAGFAPPSRVNTIDKYPFASDITAADIANASENKQGTAGASSLEFGYIMGGYVSPFSSKIDKFPFASDVNAVNIGNLSEGKYALAGQNSDTHAYTSGGNSPGDTTVENIDKYPFANDDATASQIASLSQGRRSLAGQSSTINGYSAGGNADPSPTASDTIDKFPFASEASASDVGNLVSARFDLAGNNG